MKYLLLGLLMAASQVGQPPTLLPEQAIAYAAASFDVTAPPDTETMVDLFISLNAPTSWLALRIDQSRRVCDAGACQEVTTLYGFAREQIGSAVAFVDPRLTHAWVHATVPVPDDVSQTTIPVRIDVVWTATGVERCDVAPIAAGGGSDCSRPASAMGDIWTAMRNLLAGKTTQDFDLRVIQPAL